MSSFYEIFLSIEMTLIFCTGMEKNTRTFASFSLSQVALRGHYWTHISISILLGHHQCVLSVSEPELDPYKWLIERPEYELKTTAVTHQRKEHTPLGRKVRHYFRILCHSFDIFTVIEILRSHIFMRFSNDIFFGI